MNRNARIQVGSAVGIAIAIPMVYIGLTSGNDLIAHIALTVFGTCILATPAMKVVQLLKRPSSAPQGAEARN